MEPQPLFSLELLIEAIGVDLARDLMATKGGTLVYVPAQMFPDHWLAQLLGMIAASELSDRWGGTTLNIPMGATLLRESRDRLICQMSKDMSRRQLSVRFRLSMRRIYQILEAQDCSLTRLPV